MMSFHTNPTWLTAAAVVISLFVAAPVSAADLILDHVDIVDVEQRTILRDGQIVVTDGLIEHAGPRLASLPSAEVRDATGLVAVPGFINVHTHLWQHASRGLDTSGDLQSWAGIVHQFVHYATREEMYEATFVAARQALLSGFTTTSDFAAPYSEFTLDATNTAIRDAGMGGVVMWWNPAVFLPPEVKRREMRRFAQAIRPLRLWVAQGHAFLFELPARYEGIRLAAELDLGLSEHTLETIPGIRQAYGLDSGYLRRYGARLDPGDRARLEALVRPGAPPAVNRVHWMRRLARQVLQDADAAARLRRRQDLVRGLRSGRHRQRSKLVSLPLDPRRRHDRADLGQQRQCAALVPARALGRPRGGCECPHAVSGHAGALPARPAGALLEPANAARPGRDRHDRQAGWRL
jgi:hypothetical protein